MLRRYGRCLGSTLGWFGTAALFLSLFYQLLISALSWISFVSSFVVLGLPLLVVFALALHDPARRAWGRRMLLASAFLLPSPRSMPSSRACP